MFSVDINRTHLSCLSYSFLLLDLIPYQTKTNKPNLGLNKFFFEKALLVILHALIPTFLMDFTKKIFSFSFSLK